MSDSEILGIRVLVIVTKVPIVYATDYGNTKKLAEAIASDAKFVADTEVTILLG